MLWRKRKTEQELRLLSNMHVEGQQDRSFHSSHRKQATCGRRKRGVRDRVWKVIKKYALNFCLGGFSSRGMFSYLPTKQTKRLFGPVRTLASTAVCFGDNKIITFILGFSSFLTTSPFFCLCTYVVESWSFAPPALFACDGALVEFSVALALFSLARC